MAVATLQGTLTLDDLPNELLYMIIDICDYDSKVNLSEVNHHLYALVDSRANTNHRILFNQIIEKPLGSKMTELKIAHIAYQFCTLVKQHGGSKNYTHYATLGYDENFQMSVFNINLEFSSGIRYQLCSYNSFSSASDKITKHIGDNSPRSMLLMLDIQTIYDDLKHNTSFRIHQQNDIVTKFELEEEHYVYVSEGEIVENKIQHNSISILYPSIPSKYNYYDPRMSSVCPPWTKKSH